MDKSIAKTPLIPAVVTAGKARQSSPARGATGQASWRDYYQMTKPKVVLLMLLTSLVGMYLAQSAGNPDPTIGLWLLFCANAGIGLMAAAAAALNHIVDRHIDINMARTHRRPVAQGRVTPRQGLVFAALLAAAGMALLWWQVNPLTAWLTLFSLVGYAFIYTLWLKRTTPQNIVIGGIAGAAPPLLGWCAVTNELHPHALLLVLLIFTWTPPHFWALAINRVEDYRKAGLPMLPVTHGVEFTKTAILQYTLLLMIVGLLPYLTGMSGLLYLVGSSIINCGFFYYAWQLKFEPEKRSAMSVFRYSIIHLMLLFVFLLLDRYLMLG